MTRSQDSKKHQEGLEGYLSIRKKINLNTKIGFWNRLIRMVIMESMDFGWSKGKNWYSMVNMEQAALLNECFSSMLTK